MIIKNNCLVFVITLSFIVAIVRLTILKDNVYGGYIGNCDSSCHWVNGVLACQPGDSCDQTWYWTCFAGGTRVDMESGEKLKIEDVRVGDRVVSEDEEGRRSVSTVTALDQPIREHMCKLEFVDGQGRALPLRMTEEHPIMTKEGWKALDPNKTKDENPELIVKKMQIGDVVIREDGEAMLKSVSCWSARTPAYNLILDNGAHTYFADGFLAHNKGPIILCEKNCPTGQHADWSDVTLSCHGRDVGRIQGNAVREVNTERCAYTDSEDKEHKSGRGCEYATCVPDCGTPARITLASPANGAVVTAPSGTASVVFDWNAETNWGAGEQTGNRKYDLCIGTNVANPCTGTKYSITAATNPASTYTANVAYGTRYWGVNAINKCGGTSPLSVVRSICVEGFDVNNTRYVSAWSACNANTHKRTRTCREDCGTNDCTALTAAGGLSEDCLGEIRGSLFDASNLSACPPFDPTTGYLTGIDNLKAKNTAFGIRDFKTVAPHPWAILSTAITDANGDYAVRVYAPTTYSYDFSSFATSFGVQVSPKLICQAITAVVPSNPTTCTTQPCSIVKNMSFGFQRNYGGWWQAQGAGVHGERGIRSIIPTTLTTEKSLILPDTADNNRVGVLSLGVIDSTMFGNDPLAKASSKGWMVENTYRGQFYDWAYFNQQFKKYKKTVWDGSSALVYDGGSEGYQIFTVNGNVNNLTVNPTGSEKIIFLINGNVTINSNIAVANGAFLAVIASGNITFGSGTTSVDGWYVAKSIVVPCRDDNEDEVCDKTDAQFIGNGTFVGWQSVVLARDRGIINETESAEKFVYRLDLYNNAPEALKVLIKTYRPYVP